MAKKQKNKKKHRGRWELYETSGGLKRKNKSCPKCGQGTFLAAHKERLTCGKCGYTEFTKSEPKEEKPEPAKEESKEELKKEQPKKESK